MKKLYLSILLFVALLGPTSVRADDVGTALSEFGFNYFSESKPDGNFAVSPYSLHAVLAMLTLGAEGETRTESLKALNLDEKSLSQYKLFNDSIVPEKGTLKLASRIWASKNSPPAQRYLEASETAFGSSVQVLDFRQSEAARDEINQWIGEHTDNLIPDLIPSGGVNASTEMVLSNALYFQGQWEHAFRQQNTHPGTFHSPGGSRTTPFMSGTLPIPYKVHENYLAVTLPYLHSELALAIVMPTQPEHRDLVLREFNRHMLGSLERTAREHDYGSRPTIELSLPKFDLSQKSKPIPVLSQMGLSQLLSGSGQFSLFADPRTPVSIDEIFHEVVLQVSESGTKAAASTAAVIYRSPPAKPAETITINRPFFFALYHRTSLAPLFIGQVEEPQSL